MAIFVGAYILMVIVRMLGGASENKKSKKVLCVIMGIVYFLLAALRGRTVGSDTDIYVNVFERTSNMSILDAYNNSEKDPIFYVFLKIVSIFFDSYTALFFIIALFFTVSVMRFLYKYSRDPMLSWIMALAFNLYQFTLTAMRQTLAISFVLIAFSCFFEKKWFKGVIAALLGALFHSSAIAVLAVLLLWKIKINKPVLWGSVGILGVSFILNKQIAGLVLEIFQGETTDYGISEEQMGLTMLLVIFVLYVFAVLFVNSEKLANSEFTQKLFILSFVAVFFETLVPAQPIFFRLAFYFLYALIVLVPEVILTGREKNDQVVLYLAIAGVLTLQYFMFTIGSSNILPYYTFWQPKP